MTVKDLPKLELHLHLEGAAPPAFIRGLAREKHIDLSGIFAEDGSYSYTDFWHFLKVYEAACTTLQTPEDFRRLTHAKGTIVDRLAMPAEGPDVTAFDPPRLVPGLKVPDFD